MTIYTQLPEAFFDAPGFAEKNKIYAAFIRLVATEDEAMLESLQTGVSSRGYAPGPTVQMERAIHHLLNDYLDTLLEDDEQARDGRIWDGAAALVLGSAKYPEPVDGGYSKSFGTAPAAERMGDYAGQS